MNSTRLKFASSRVASSSGPRRVVASTELAHGLANAAFTYRSSLSEKDLAKLGVLVRVAAAHIRRVGEGTVDHIVLSAELRRISLEIPSVLNVLQEAEWQWFR